jgi:predicted ABC-type ATPase
MQEIIIIAGPNGAGKTSFANKYLSSFRGRFVFLNADEVAREIVLQGVPQAQLDILNIAFETTLASLSYAKKIPTWQQAGCSVALVYLRLASVEMSIERVRRRVAQGGHGIPEDVIRKRFTKSLDYFERLYRSIVDEWYIWDSLEGSFEPAEKWDDR